MTARHDAALRNPLPNERHAVILMQVTADLIDDGYVESSNEHLEATRLLVAALRQISRSDIGRLDQRRIAEFIEYAERKIN